METSHFDWFDTLFDFLIAGTWLDPSYVSDRRRPRRRTRRKNRR